MTILANFSGILFRYIIRSYFRYVFGTIVLCTFLFILFDFIHRTTGYFVRYQPSFKHILQLYVLQVPAFLVQGLPIASLMASVVTMVLLSRNNEITAMRAAGMGPWAVATPLAVGGMALSLMSLVLGETVLPQAAARVGYVKSVLIEGEPDAQTNEGVRWVRDQNRLFHFRVFDSLTQTMSGVRLLETGSGFQVRSSTEASRALYQADRDSWILYDVKHLTFRHDGSVARLEREEQREMSLPIDPAKLRKERRKPSEMSLVELWEIISKGEAMGVDVSSFRVEMHLKFAYSFAAFVVGLIGIRFGYRSERTMETARSVLIAFLIGTSYWFILNAGRALGRYSVHPFLSAWLANFIILGIALVMIWRVRKI